MPVQLFAGINVYEYDVFDVNEVHNVHTCIDLCRMSIDEYYGFDVVEGH